ncbi:probable choline kinase 2 [Vigna unguiculata]|uniref:probable choline kinase 2 n=1 Tax=Vigna unguiculata TaxID=3917 RepID=UPI001016608E|nr:probable choline kinase 2 [Vigna unguiculata]
MVTFVLGAAEEATPNPVNNKAVDAENVVSSDHAEIPGSSEIKGTEVPKETSAKEGEYSIPSEATEILKSLAAKWENVIDANALKIIPLKGAMTNEVYQIKWKTTEGESSRKVLTRIYGEGTAFFFDRGVEVKTFEFMSKSGQGPRLLGRFDNGRIEEFIHARTLSASDLREPSTSALIAAKMKEFHDIDMPGQKTVNLWDRLRDWLKEAKRLSSPEDVEAFKLNSLDNEISTLEKELSGSKQCIGFCHNDLQYGNIMLDEESCSVTLIDYEYASYNPVAYDIANHFNEMAANYHTDTPHVLDFTKYPDLEERRRFVQAYLSSSGEQPSDTEVQQLVDEVEKYALASHLLWGIWGVISLHVNKIEFKYREYAEQRFQQYWSRKTPVVSSNDSSDHDNGLQAAASTTHHRAGRLIGIPRRLKRLFNLGFFRSKH